MLNFVVGDSGLMVDQMKTFFTTSNTGEWLCKFLQTYTHNVKADTK